ncbi:MULTISPECIES: hypothetical protein [unclassified Treponema]|uniref:hypothetical protein n=1 Tax=unclassified Treponema TaxID=2638727 RepID=UPI0020A33356|nr:MULTISPECIES: hypothetical protein [unclassified Treponema]UTC67059.1 hypothetical protein E4O06_14160 [Treponema sp. OMZ 789]UTC69790.1 hypothetical protein E4O01_14300 [Treponema sp. OMZ 790]UTC72504.1 hypothetical protein E4O02_14390 [Treponema sp. OMZ 791]
MKVKRYIFILISLVFALIVSCNQWPIFAAIEQEIRLKNFSVEGDVSSLIEDGSNVYAANLAGVYSKSKSSNGPWSKILSYAGTQNLAYDGTNVFVSSAEGPVKYSGNWGAVPNSDNIHLIAGNKIVFGYNASEKKVYKIGTGGVSNPIDVGVVESLSAAGNYFLVKSKDSAKLYKDGTPAAEVAGLPSGAIAVCPADSTDHDKIFVLAGSTIHYYNGSAWASSKSIKEKSPISISYFKERETILLGCTQGYTEVKVNTTPSIDLSNENTKQLDPGDEGSTTPPGSYSQYQTTLGSYNTNPMLGVSRGGSGYAVFMGIHSGVITRNKGLWGFYSDKPEWNRE